ncbi:phosphate acetyltransferase [Buchnera aphidicola]|uniref:phosphate acetyltransferase n=1 Tax=Buchnera aphidicola TaxID=9 RepID=UPI0031B809F3
MTRTIMLVPVGDSFGLTTISISLINILNKKKKKIVFLKLYSKYLQKYISRTDTASFLKKYFFIPSISLIHKDFDLFFSEKVLQKLILEEYFQLYLMYKKKYDIIFIEGMKVINNNFFIHEMNIKFAQIIHAELVFYSLDTYYDIFLRIFSENLNKFSDLNILGVINNFCHFPIKDYFQDIAQKKFLFKKYKKKNYANKKLITKVIHLNWKRDLIYYPVSIILKSIQAKVFFKNHDINIIKTFVLHNSFLLNKKNFYQDSCCIISFNQFIEICHNELLRKLFLLNFNFFLLTECNYCNLYKLKILIQSLKLLHTIFYTLLSIKTVVSQISNVRSILYLKNSKHVDSVLKYITSYRNIHDILKKDTSYREFSVTNYYSENFKNYLMNESIKLRKRILLPEGDHPKIIQSANMVSNLGMAQCILLGDKNKIEEIAQQYKIHLSKKIIIINPNEIYQNYIEKLFILRCKRGMTREKSAICVKDRMILGSLMLLDNEVDGVVCGIQYNTSDVLRTALQIIGVKKSHKDGLQLASSIFFMLFRHRVLIYGDCAININPNAEQLCQIAISTADFVRLFNIQPKIAMLSYSTGNSGSGEPVEKVLQATKLVKLYRPDLTIDGPIQYDAAVNQIVSSVKSPHSPLHGESNILIFPDLNSGNITYKAVQQSSKIISIGPILQGFLKPVNDLSRGATIYDIIYTIAITAMQSKSK